MNETEKALELVNSFKGLVNPYNQIGNAFLAGHESHEQILANAKECARIAVREIINSNPHSNPLNTEPVVSTMEYWLKVEKEIEKL